MSHARKKRRQPRPLWSPSPAPALPFWRDEAVEARKRHVVAEMDSMTVEADRLNAELERERRDLAVKVVMGELSVEGMEDLVARKTVETREALQTMIRYGREQAEKIKKDADATGRLAELTRETQLAMCAVVDDVEAKLKAAGFEQGRDSFEDIRAAGWGHVIEAGRREVRELAVRAERELRDVGGEELVADMWPSGAPSGKPAVGWD